MLPSSVQWSWFADAVPEKTLPIPGSARKTSRLVAGFSTEATRMLHRGPSRFGANMARSSTGGIRRNASSLPSGENAGDPSRSTAGSSQRTVPSSKSWIPTNEWAPRLETNARSEPSGESRRLPRDPRTSINCSASAPGSSPIRQTLPCRTNSRAVPSAVNSGLPAGSVRRRGRSSITHSARSTPSGRLSGLGSSPARLGPSPRTKAMREPSRLNARPEMVVPSSPEKSVARRPWKSGASATQTFRAPCSSNTHATRLPSGDAVRLVGNGAEKTCSRVKGLCAGAAAGTSRRAASASGRVAVRGAEGRWSIEASLISGRRGAPAGASPRG